jgi:peptidyl-prolyl cis-trans isomerase A (cyclophilin A)
MNRHLFPVTLALASSLAVFACKSTAAETVPAPEPAPSPAPLPSPKPPVEPSATAVPAASPVPAPSEAPINPVLFKPENAKAKAPAKYKVKITTTKGDFVVEVTRAWAPLGADRLYNLVKLGFMQDLGFFRVVPDFVMQFGIHGDPRVAAVWRNATIKDDGPTKQSNKKGTLTFAKSGSDTRTTQLFINLADNQNLDQMGFPPIGKVIQGMDVIEAINKEYGEMPQQKLVQTQGNAYLKRAFPHLDYIRSATLLK